MSEQCWRASWQQPHPSSRVQPAQRLQVLFWFQQRSPHGAQCPTLTAQQWRWMEGTLLHWSKRSSRLNKQQLGLPPIRAAMDLTWQRQATIRAYLPVRT